jgi:putative transposase
MRRSRYTEEQIVGILKEHEAGLGTEELCRRHGISQQTFYRWEAKYGGLDVGDAQRLTALEDENGVSNAWSPTSRWTMPPSRTCCQKAGEARGAALGGPLPG